jgi:DNA-binding beta-propeller fold protein YncE
MMMTHRALQAASRAWAPALLGFFSMTSGCAAPPPPVAAAPVAPPPPAPAVPAPVPVASTPAPAPAPAPLPERPPQPASVALAVERAIPVGKWPEGVVVVGDAAWIAESGGRRVVKVDLARGEITARVSVGRLPVEMASSLAGEVYSLIHTDKEIWTIDPASARGRVLVRLPDDPEDMVYADGALWVLLWAKGSSQGSSVVRVDPATGRLTRSPELGPNAFALAVGHGRVWVAHGGGAISVVDQATLAPTGDLAVRDQHRLIAVGQGAVYADTRDGVVRIDPATGKVTHEVTLGAQLSVLSAEGDHLLAVDRAGRGWRLDPADLHVTAALSAPAGMGEPHAVAFHNGRLLFTDYSYRSGEPERADGRLLVVTPR